MQTIHKSHHTIEDIFYTNKRIKLECLTSQEKFDNLKYFWSSIFGNLKHIEIHRENDLVSYQVELYRDKNRVEERREEFYAILKNGRKERVWKPSLTININSFPDGYGFTSTYLNLTYQKKPLSRSKFFSPILGNIEYTDEIMKLSGYLFIPSNSNYNLSKFVMKFSKFRKEEISMEFPFELTLVGKKEVFGVFPSELFSKFTENDVFIFNTEIPLSKISSYSGIFNIVIENDSRPRLIQNYHPSLTKKEHLFDYIHNKNRIALHNFYYDDIVKVWRFEIYQMSIEDREKLDSLKEKKRNDFIWLTGEYTISARDNAMHFYHYILKQHPHIELYYVIEKSSPDYKNLNPTRVIEYGSFEHFEIASQAKVLVFSHMPNYLIPKIETITNYKNKYQSYLRVFLQHGVIATTTSMNAVRKEVRDYDFFNVSSELEKSFITKHLHYESDEVIINGLPRWDRLYNEKNRSNTILIIPTHRNNLEKVTSEVFLESRYFNFWNNLLTNTQFIDYIEENNIIIHFFIHIILARFIDKFTINSKNIMFKNGDNVQDLLLNCGMLITDYSSVSFDALYQNKPVIYVPFDFDDMLKLRGGEQYIDFEKDLPADICYSIKETIDSIKQITRAGWKVNEKYEDRRLKFFKNIDNKNSERVFNSILEHKKINCKIENYIIKEVIKLNNRDLQIEVIGFLDSDITKISEQLLILKSRKSPLDSNIRVEEFKSSKVKQFSNGFIQLSFILPLNKLMIESDILIYTFDFFLGIANREYRLQYYNKEEKIFKSLNYDFIPYVTKYQSYSVIAIRKTTKLQNSTTPPSVLFVMFRIDYKDKETQNVIELANVVAKIGYSITIIVMDVLSIANNIPISKSINFEYLSNYIHRKKGILPLDIYNPKAIVHNSFIPIVRKYFTNISSDILYFSAVNLTIFNNILEVIPKDTKVILNYDALKDKDINLENYIKSVDIVDKKEFIDRNNNGLKGFSISSNKADKAKVWQEVLDLLIK